MKTKTNCKVNVIRTQIMLVFLSLLILSLFSNCENKNRKGSDKSKTIKDDSVISEIQDKKAEKSEIFNCDYLGEKLPKEEPVKFAPGIFSGGCFEISTTGNEIQFSRSGNIYIMSKTDTGWEKPYVAPFSGTNTDGESTFLPDGKKIYFMSNRPLANAKSLMNTWVSEKVNGIWISPHSLKLPSFNKTIHAVTMAKSGNIYFSGLYKITYNNEKDQNIESLKPNIKGAHPFIALDESYLIFDRRMNSSSDLYIIYSRTDGTWTQPIKLNNKINTPSQEVGAFVTPDGKFMFFSRKSDIYWVSADFIEELKPKE